METKNARYAMLCTGRFWLNLLNMVQKNCLITFISGLLVFCTSCRNVQFLDSSIPRVVTPPGQIAVVRTKWVNGKLLQTTFLDSQDRVLEDFMYGRTSQKILNQYSGNLRSVSITYYHNDSSPSGYITISKNRFNYDAQGRVIRVVTEASDMGTSGIENRIRASAYTYAYADTNDTLVSPSPVPDPNSSTKVNVNHWERNEQGQLVRNFRLYVVKGPHDPRLDTVYCFSHRFSYDHLGRRNLAWYDLMYLGQFYMANGPDTIRYFYDKRNRLMREIHRYTSDRRNKREIDTTTLNRFERRSARDSRQRFFDSQRVFYNSNRTDTIEYYYEPFKADNHLPLQVSEDVDY